MKFAIGDRVKYTGNDTGHNKGPLYDIGVIIEISSLTLRVKVKSDQGEEWYAPPGSVILDGQIGLSDFEIIHTRIV